MLPTRGRTGRQAHVIPSFYPNESRLCRKGQLSAPCHRIVMSHSIRAPGPIQFKICWKTPAKGFWKMFLWLRDIINNSKLLMSSSLQPSLSILVYTIQEKVSLAIRCVKRTCQLSRFPQTEFLFEQNKTSLEANFTSVALWPYGILIRASKWEQRQRRDQWFH